MPSTVMCMRAMIMPAMSRIVNAVPPKVAAGTAALRMMRGGVIRRVLQGMARFVSGDSDGSRRPTVIDVAAQPENPVSRIIMVRKRARHLFDGDILTAGLIQNVPGRRCAGESRRNLHAGSVRAFDLVLRIEHQHDRRGEKDKIHRIEIVKKHGDLHEYRTLPRRAFNSRSGGASIVLSITL